VDGFAFGEQVFFSCYLLEVTKELRNLEANANTE